MTSESLVDRCKRGDPSAWRQLFDDFVRAVHRWALGFGIDSSGAEEVTQDVFATAVRKISRCGDDGQLPSWLFQITRRQAANYRRRASLRRALGLSELFQVPAEDDGRLQDGRRAELSLEIRRTLRKLPVHLVEVLILHDLDGHTQGETARILGVPAGTVASRLRTAREQFEKKWARAGGRS